MTTSNLIQNISGKGIDIQKLKNQNGPLKPGFVNRTINNGNKSDLFENFVAPDGGWGWLIAIASGMSILVTYPVLEQFGILFRHKFSNIGISSSEMTTIINVQQAAAMCSGLINGPLFRRFSHRQVALIGNFFVFSGLFLAAFANSFILYIISISLLYGVGRGIMFSTMTVAVNTYFKTKRQQATAYQYAVAGLGPMFLPYVVTFFVSYYGVAGAVLLLSGLSLHNLACSVIYQPVKWHAKKVPRAIPLHDLKHHEYDEDENSDYDKPCVFATCKLEVNNQTSNSNGPRNNVTLEVPTEKTPMPDEHDELLENHPQNSFGPCASEKLSILQRIVVMFDLDLLKDFGYVNIVMGLTMMNIIHMNFHYLTPFVLNEFGLDSNQIAAAMTVEAFCAFAMKFVLVLIVGRIKCENKTWLIIGCWSMTVGRLVLVLNTNKIAVLCCFGWIGFSAAILLVFWVLVLPCYVPLNKLPAAIGLQRLIMGITSLIIGPFIGLIRDATNYSCLIHIMNGIILVVTISWLCEDLYRKRRRPKMQANAQKNDT